MARRADLEVVSKGMYWDGPEGTWQVTFHFAELGGRRECVGMDVRSIQAEVVIDDEGRARQRFRKFLDIEPHRLTVSELRVLPIATWMRWAREELRREMAARADDRDTEEDAGAALADVARALEPRPGIYDEAHFARVAAIYSRAWKAGEAPTKAVAEELSTSRTAAAKWVARARKLGLLGETEKRKPGGVAAKVTKKGKR